MRRLGDRPMTATERSARRREREKSMWGALVVIANTATTLPQAKRIAMNALAAAREPGGAPAKETGQ